VLDLSSSTAVVLLGAGMLAGACNAIAGGGTFFSFPAFLAAGLPPVVANASNAVAVWPGHAFAAIGYRRDLGSLSHSIRGSLVVALVGGVTGAVLRAVVAIGLVLSVYYFHE
jgi:uncharacterized membrane protein YfcA